MEKFKLILKIIITLLFLPFTLPFLFVSVMLFPSFEENLNRLFEKYGVYGKMILSITFLVSFLWIFDIEFTDERIIVFWSLFGIWSGFAWSFLRFFFAPLFMHKKEFIKEKVFTPCFCFCIDWTKKSKPIL